MTGARERCRREIDEALTMLRAGHPDMHGLLLMLMDWSCELRWIEESEQCLS